MLMSSSATSLLNTCNTTAVTDAGLLAVHAMIAKAQTDAEIPTSSSIIGNDNKSFGVAS